MFDSSAVLWGMSRKPPLKRLTTIATPAVRPIKKNRLIHRGVGESRIRIDAMIGIELSATAIATGRMCPIASAIGRV
jgi:hypothetical protein